MKTLCVKHGHFIFVVGNDNAIYIIIIAREFDQFLFGTVADVHSRYRGWKEANEPTKLLTVAAVVFFVSCRDREGAGQEAVSRAAAPRPAAAFTAPCVAVGYSVRPGPAVTSHHRRGGVERPGEGVRLSDLSGFWSATASDQVAVAVASGDPSGSGLLPAGACGRARGGGSDPPLDFARPRLVVLCRTRSFQGSPGRSRGTPALLGAGDCCWAGSLTPSPLRRPVSRGGDGERERGRG